MAAGGDFEFLILPMCVCCWVLPLIVIGITYGITRSIMIAVAMRGVGDDGLYCAKCKFDLRGNTGWDCPECGMHLDQKASFDWPRGGVLDKTINPPMSRVMAVILFVTGGLVPSIMAVAVLGMILPINYQTDSSAEVFPDVPVKANMPFPMYVTFDGSRERSWTGGGDFERLTMIPSTGERIWINTDESPAQLQQQAERAWLRLSSQEGWVPPDIDAEPYRAEFIELFVTIAEGEMGQAESNASLFTVGRQDYTEPSFHPLYTVFGVVVVMVAIGLLFWWALRESARNEKAYHEKVTGIRDRFNRVIETNRKRSGMTS